MRFTTGAIRVEPDRHACGAAAARAGCKLHESARKLARRIEAGTARIMSATVRRDGGRWFVSFTCEVERTERGTGPAGRGGRRRRRHQAPRGAVHRRTGAQPAPPRRRPAHGCARLARRLSRKTGPDRRTGAAAVEPVAARPPRRSPGRTHRVANLRRDGLHKLTTRLAREYGTVVVEDLNVAGMLRNRRLARRIADAGFGEIRRQLGVQDRVERRPARRGRPLVPVLEDLLGLRRGENQAAPCRAHLHLRHLRPGPGPGRQRRTSTSPRSRLTCTSPGVARCAKGRGADRKTRPGGQVAVKRQPGTAPAGKTGTVPPQGGTSDQMLTKAS